MDQQEGLSSAEKKHNDAEEEKKNEGENKGSASAPSIECQNCHVCKSSLTPSKTVLYQGTLKDVLTEHINEASKVSSTESQNQAEERKIDSFWCPTCKVNFVLFKDFKNIKQFLSSTEVQPQNESQLKGPSLDIFKGELWPRVKIFPSITGQTFGADEAIMEKVKKNYLLTYWLAPMLEKKQSPEESSVVIVFCPITSRVGSDVESAMTNPQVSSLDKPVILVLMHHTRDPGYSTEGTKWSDVYKNVVLEVHLLFHQTTPGLLTCQQNDQAIEAIDKKLYEYTLWPSFFIF